MMYRFFEILPGLLTWLAFILIILLSLWWPKGIAVFFIIYTFFWLCRIIYLHFHLRYSFREVRENLKVGWLEKLKELDDDNDNNDGVNGSHDHRQKSWSEVYHLVILPMYRESLAVVRETFLALRAANYPKGKILVVLATEERAGAEAVRTAESIKNEFGGDFFRFLITVHPSNLDGEIPGKGSNETWAAKEAKTKIIDLLQIPHEKIIVSVFDCDTQAAPEYFGRLTYLFLTSERPLRSSYQPVPLFINNIYQAPIFSRVMSFFPTFWQMMQQSRSEQLSTFTSQAMPFEALVDVGFWDTHLVSEDSLIFWKFYLHYDGDWRTVPMYYPVSMDATSGKNFWEAAQNLYRQQRRWAWGAENIPYMLSGFMKNKKIPLRKKIFWTFIFMEGFFSWSTAPFILFILGWLPLFIGPQEFSETIISYNLTRTVRPILNLSIIFLFASAILSIVLLPPKPGWFKKKHYFLYFLQWLLVPVLIMVWSAVPAIEAQTRLMLGGKFRLGFWPTPKSR